MRRIRTERTYGLLIVSIVIGVALWLAYDTQASIHAPGWLARAQEEVWCLTRLDRPDGGGMVFSHYPGKSLRRLMQDHGFTPQQQQMVLAIEDTASTTCYATWREAAGAHQVFQELAQEFPAVIAGWSEAEYEEAILSLSFGNVNQQAEALRQRLLIEAVHQKR